MATPIRIRIGASKDSSVDAVFRSIRRQGIKVAADVARANARGQEMMIKAANKAREAQIANTKKAGEAAIAELVKLRQETERTYQKMGDAAKRSYDKAAGAGRRSSDSQKRDADRLSRSWERFRTRTSHRATRFFLPNAPIGSFAARAGRDILRGVGVQTNLGAHVGNIVEQERLARNLTTQAYIKGAPGAAGNRVDPRMLVDEMRSIGKAVGIDTTSMLTGGKRFVGQRGNLAGFRGLAKELGIRATATGTDFGDLAMTAAKIDSALASQKGFRDQDKGGEQARNRAILTQLDVLSRQGKIGSVEFDQQAKQLPKLSGIAASFGGDVAGNLTKLMTVMQLAERGPAKNSATAATYAQNFALDLQKASGRFDKLIKFDIFDGKGPSAKLKDAQTIIEETLARTEKGKTVRGQRLNQTELLSKLMPNKRSFLAFQEFLNVFRGAGGGAKGIQAVRDEFERFGATNAGQLAEDFDSAMKGAGKRAKQFNQELEQVVQEMAANVFPKMEKLGPAAVRAAQWFTSAVEFSVDNPMTAVAGALTLAIGRAGIESAARTGIESLIGKFAKMSLMNKGLTLTGLTIAATTATIIAKELMRGDEDQRRREARSETEQETERQKKAADERRQKIEKSIESGNVTAARVEQEKGLIEEEKRQGEQSALIEAARRRKEEEAGRTAREDILKNVQMPLGAPENVGGFAAQQSGETFADMFRSFFSDVFDKSRDQATEKNIEALERQNRMTELHIEELRSLTTAITDAKEQMLFRPGYTPMPGESGAPPNWVEDTQ